MEAPASRDVLAIAPDDRHKPVLNHGFVELCDMMPRFVALGRIGAEAAIVDAARVSYGEGTRRVSSDRTLLRYLLRHQHTTPFEQVNFVWRVKAPIFVQRQWRTHRTSSFNEESARYSVVRDEGYVPAAAEVKAQATGVLASAQSGSEPLEHAAAVAVAEKINEARDAAYSTYADLLACSVSREVARTVLPLGMYTTFFWKIDLWNLFHFLRLRMNPRAQEQTRAYAKAIYAILQKVVPEAMSAFDDYIYGTVTLTRPEVEAIRAAAVSGAPLMTAEPVSEENPLSCREREEWHEKRAYLYGGEV